VPSLRHLDDPAGRSRLLGCVVYLVAIVVTAAYHVPRNDALAAIDPASGGAADYWRHWASSWTAWNHVRTLASLTSAVAFTVAVRIG
jgi:uncharacterized membrane protein